MFHLRRKRTPTVMQMEATECGAACLAMILGYYGRYVPLEPLRVKCGVTRDGSNALNLVQAAEDYGLVAEGYSAELDDLFDIEGPCILFWKFNHFIVLEHCLKYKALINDPATGPRSITYDELDEGFTGVVITFEKGESFQKAGSPPSLTAALYQRLQGSGNALFFLFLAGLCLIAPGLALPAFTRVFVDDIFSSPQLSWEVGFSLSIAITLLITASLTHLQQYFLNRLQQKLSICLSSEFLWHILRLPLTFYAQRFSGEIAYRMQLNSSISQTLTGTLATTTIDLVLIIFYALVMYSYDVVLATTGVIAAVINLIVLLVIDRSRKDSYTRLIMDLGKSYAISIDAMQHIDTIKASGAESDFFARWGGYYAKAANAEQESGKKDVYLTNIPQFLQTLTTALVLIIGGWRIMEGALSIGMLMALQTLMVAFLMPVLRFVNFGAVIQTLKSHVDRLDDVLHNKQDSVYEEGFSEKTVHFGHNPIKLAGYLEFHNVTFGYSPLDPPLLENFHFSLPPGGRLALVGPTGCGKSTITRLAANLFKPWEGEITYDGKLLKQFPRELFTRSLATVDQEIFLFAGTIRENLTLWDSTASEEDMIASCKDACIHEDIISREKNYDSVLTEGGKNLSGGQRQRLEIARALLMKPTILLLDEATSALDSQTEKLIIDNIRKRGCTCILVAHRLSTIRDADEIIVLEKGKVVQRGTHDKLKSQEGVYKELVDKEGFLEDE